MRSGRRVGNLPAWINCRALSRSEPCSSMVGVPRRHRYPPAASIGMAEAAPHSTRIRQRDRSGFELLRTSARLPARGAWCALVPEPTKCEHFAQFTCMRRLALRKQFRWLLLLAPPFAKAAMYTSGRSELFTSTHLGVGYSSN